MIAVLCWHRPGRRTRSFLMCRHCGVAIEECPCVKWNRSPADDCPLCQFSGWIATVRIERARFAEYLLEDEAKPLGQNEPSGLLDIQTSGYTLGHMSTLAVAQPTVMTPEVLETVLVRGDLSQLSPAQRLDYLRAVCESVKLNPLTRPLEYIELDGKLCLYARKDATDQLRAIHRVSTKILDRRADTDGSTYTVVALASTPDGRQEEAIGAVPLVKELGDWKKASSGKAYFEPNGQTRKLSPVDRCNAQMKCETKAKRRATLSICGLGAVIDESELDTLPKAIMLNNPPPTIDERVERAGRSAETILREFENLYRGIVDICGSDRPFFEVLASHGWKSTDEVRTRKIRESHLLIQALGAKLDAIQSAVNAQPPEDAA